LWRLVVSIQDICRFEPSQKDVFAPQKLAANVELLIALMPVVLHIHHHTYSLEDDVIKRFFQVYQRSGCFS